MPGGSRSNTKAPASLLVPLSRRPEASSVIVMDAWGSLAPPRLEMVPATVAASSVALWPKTSDPEPASHTASTEDAKRARTRARPWTMKPMASPPERKSNGLLRRTLRRQRSARPELESRRWSRPSFRPAPRRPGWVKSCPTSGAGCRLKCSAGLTTGRGNVRATAVMVRIPQGFRVPAGGYSRGAAGEAVPQGERQAGRRRWSR